MARPLRPRPRLAEARTRRGWSQEDAAERIGVSATTWSRWERGRQDVRPAYRARIAAECGVGLAQVASWLDGAPLAEPLPWSSPAAGSSVGAAVASATATWSADVDASRRQALAELPFVAGDLAEWLLAWSLDAPPETRARTAEGRRVGLSDVERIEAARTSFSQMDHLSGAGLVRPAVVDYLHHQVAPLLRGSYSDRVGGALLSAAAGVTRLAAWEAYDLLRPGLAQGEYEMSLALCKASDDTMTGAWVLAAMAQQAIDLREPVWAVRLARAARTSIQDPPGRVEALLLVREARATALGVHLADGDRHSASRAERLLARAEEAFARPRNTTDEPTWVRSYAGAELVAESGCAWRLLGDAARAADCARRALADLDHAFARSAALNSVHLAEAHLAAGDLDAALDAARVAVPAIRPLTSHRPVQLVRGFTAAATAAHPRERRVAEWQTWLRGEMPAAV